MEDFPKFTVNKIGEGQLLAALKSHDIDQFRALLKNDCCPYIPSPFGQCAAGLKEYWPAEALADFYDDWFFDERLNLKNCEEPPFALIRRAKNDRLAYTLPILTGIHLAAALNDVEEIKYLHEHNTRFDAWGYLPLIYAVGCNHLEAVAALETPYEYVKKSQGCFLSDPFDIVSPGFYRVPFGMTCRFKLPMMNPLESAVGHALTIHQAAARGDMNKLRTLIELGVYVDIRSFNGSTPLLCAALYGQVDACRYLLDQGANRQKENYLGESAERLINKLFDVQAVHKKREFLGQNEQQAIETCIKNKDHLGTLSVRPGYKGHKTPQQYKLQDQNQTIETEEHNENLVYQSHLVEGIALAAIKGDFQSMVHAYLALDEDHKHDIPRDLIEQVKKAPSYPNKDLLISWLFIAASCQDKSVMKTDYTPSSEGQKLLGFGGTNAVLRFLKDGYGINQCEGLLKYACEIEDPGLIRWLLRYGVGADIELDNLSTKSISIIQHEQKLRQSVIDQKPPIISDELLFAITTNNIELLDEYIEHGFDFNNATTAHGLTLFEFSRLVDNIELHKYLVALQRGIVGFYRQIPIFDQEVEVPQVNELEEPNPTEDEKVLDAENEPYSAGGFYVPLGSDDGSIEVDIDEESQQDQEQLLTTYQPEPELGGGLSVFNSDEEEKPPIDSDSVPVKNNGYLYKIKLPSSYEHNLNLVQSELYKLPFPQLVVDAFIHAQQLTEEKQLRSNIKDENTLELFWALKLYAMAKIDQLKE